MPTPEQALRERSEHLSALTRSQLGDSWADTLRARRLRGKRRRRGESPLAWLQDPEVRAHLDEFSRRISARAELREAWLRTFDDGLPPAA